MGLKMVKKIAVTGATGLIGQKLIEALTRDGIEVIALSRRVRTTPHPIQTAFWDPANGQLDPSVLDGADAIVHLAGETISNRWTRAQKERIRRSRVEGTRLIVEAAKKLSRPPRIFVGASAIGFYGDHGDDEIDETSPPGSGFLPEVCQNWEAEARRAESFGARTVNLRIGLVLSTKGGALAKMLLPFKMGLGGPMGSGQQWMSWIHIDDVVAIIRFVLDHNELRGPVNTTTPHPVRQAEFAKELGRALGRPAIAPAPGFALRLIFGEMAQSLLLEGQKVLPHRLEETGYTFKYPALPEALANIIRNQK